MHNNLLTYKILNYESNKSYFLFNDFIDDR